MDSIVACLFLQFMVDHSDREMEKQLRYTMAYPWFCGFSAFKQTPDHSSADKQARFGCKGKQTFWFGYKGHVGVDMRSGLIEKAAVTPANVSDQAGLKSICPRDGQLVFGDKAYCLKAATDEMARRGVTCGAILRQNMKRKNKVQFQFFMDAIVHNVKRLVAIHAPPLFQGA